MVGFALGWPIEWLIQRFPLGEGTPPSVRRRWLMAGLTAGLFAALTWQIGIEPQLAPALLLTALIVPASVIDINHRIIPNLINYPGAVLVFVVACIAQPDRIAEFAISGILCFVFLGTAWLISPRGMGLGDVKMALMIGLGTGRYAYVALLFGFIASTALSAYLLISGTLGICVYNSLKGHRFADHGTEAVLDPQDRAHLRVRALLAVSASLVIAGAFAVAVVANS